ncbi:LPS export ABC transporter permease LptF/LPS export ABC transporter permease LptG,TIGR04408 [Granulicella rosea]|uniref:LPS export ABC transporter permease LptF/LPS export ABC transporter permease LptG,TIGR04408 n=1 Tax=Granulicella rosea TaxID=474952 RepID=A0A239ISA6_9BACT|nr:LptF/LptG family permease [Granulicella rosea]SNS96520.1 LPS export ABC transporter permease LptF/LPS export ABC transporter permease LptG,TIGR04408 [Granulicella rosea]
MRILTRYILGEVLSHALLGGVLFTFVLFMRIIGKLLELLVNGTASVPDVARMILYTLPGFLTVTIPMAVLVGILLGLSRLASDSEITAMRAAGMGALDFVRIISILSTVALALGLLNTLYLEPKGAASLLALEDSLKSSQGSFEVQPRVFYENFKNYVLYVQDVKPVAGAAIWKHVFLADLTKPATPHITTADQALVTPGGPGTLTLHLRDGSQHDISTKDPNQYNISTFATTEMPIQTGAQEDTHISRSDTVNLALPLDRLLALASTGSHSTPAQVAAARPYRIEFNRRFSYPFACLVLMLVGVPLGLSSKRGGKSTGFVLTILLVFVYYFLSSVGVALAKQGKLSPFLGVWGANLIFAAAGALLLQQMSRGGVALSLVSTIGVWLKSALDRLRPNRERAENASREHKTTAQRFRGAFHTRFPLILDDYILREYAANFALVLGSFSTLFLIFTFFELIGDIIRNRSALVTVGDYLLNLIPYILYNVTPLCSLVAVLITFGALSKTSELTAMKSAGLSLYRIVAPVLVLTAVIACALFAFDEFYLPAANRRQEALRSEIKGKPAQTFLRPDRKWISGQSSLPPEQAFNSVRVEHPGGPARVFYYQFFDPDKNVFANLTVFELDPHSFTLTRRIFAASARWDDKVNGWIFENGWERTFSGESTAGYNSFSLSTFPEIHEQPGYFKKEDRQSQEMSFGELSGYIADLRQSGFDTKRLSVQLNRKIAYPAITLVMAILAIPFSLSAGKRGGVAGFAIAILMAISYLAVAGLFEAMGNVNTLPPALAAWTPDALFALAGGYLLLRTPT